MLPHIFFYSRCQEIKQQVVQQTTVFVQVTYKSHKEVPRHIPVVPKHMADICTSDYFARCGWRSARLKFIPILNQKVRALLYPPVYFLGTVCAWCLCVYLLYLLIAIIILRMIKTCLVVFIRDLTKLRRGRQLQRQKAINNNSARASRFFVHFFAVSAQLRLEMTKF